MQTSLAQNRHLILITFILALLFTLFYVFQPITQTKVASIEQVPVVKKKVKTVCDKVDIPWLASDRQYWDGWSDKAMFIRSDGTFTKGNVYINQGQEICIVLLLGPTPAKASIKDESSHSGPKDSIVLFANGETSAKMTIQLQQHEEQTNVYFAVAHFQQADTYKLNGINEYRSYFWESPVSHTYQPHSFESQNKLIVRPTSSSLETKKLPMCDLKSNQTNTMLKGFWVDKSMLQENNHLELFTAYEKSENMYSVNDKVFMADKCIMEYKSSGQGAQCLGKKIVHVFGDNNVRRNLKVIKSGKDWCNLEEIRKIKNKKERNEKLKCGCNDDNEDTFTEYPWLHNSSEPLQLTNAWDIDSKIYYNSIRESIGNHQNGILQSIQQFATKETIPTADIVIVGLGNADVEAIQVSPEQFATSFKQFLSHLRQEIYPNQKIIIKTPQYFCCGSIWASSWNTGRSLAFTLSVRDAVRELNDINVLLWDVHAIGTDETTCLPFGSSYSKRNVVNVENLLLWNLIC